MRVGAGHTQRLEDMFPDVIVVTAAGYLFDRFGRWRVTLHYTAGALRNSRSNTSRWDRSASISGLREPEHGGSGEHLIHGADAKTRIHLVGNVVFAAGQSIGTGEDELVPFGDHYGSGEAVFDASLLDFDPKCRDGSGLTQPGWGGRVRRPGELAGGRTA